jgi:hypothetical protein
LNHRRKCCSRPQSQDCIPKQPIATHGGPKQWAYATVAGHPVAAGFYTAFVPDVTSAKLLSGRRLAAAANANHSHGDGDHEEEKMAFKDLPDSENLRKGPKLRPMGKEIGHTSSESDRQ